jgi:hypothetical protein
VKHAPDWLAEMQARFGAVIRTPLDRATGTLRATPDAYDASAIDDAIDRSDARAHDRLAIYNRQYWFRLFGVMQSAYPLTTRLFGHWRFNEHAARFLLKNPPRGWDVDRAPDGFEDFLSRTLDASLEAREAFVEAARIDAAAFAVSRAPEIVPFRPTEADAARLLDARLDPSPATAIIVEHWPLAEMRTLLSSASSSRASDDESPIALPAKLDRPRWIALVREASSIRHLALHAREGELLDLLRRHTVRDALARLELACTEDERRDLPARTRRWLARSVELGMWIGLVG